MRANTSWVAPVVIAAAAVSLAAGVGMTMTDLGPWYKGLKQPDWAFGVIWTAVFPLTACSAVCAWRRAPSQRAAEALVGLFAFNGFLNLLWSLLFFKMHRPDWALLLLPYLIWVAIAAALNYQVVTLNRPFV